MPMAKYSKAAAKCLERIARSKQAKLDSTDRAGHDRRACSGGREDSFGARGDAFVAASGTAEAHNSAAAAHTQAAQIHRLAEAHLGGHSGFSVATTHSQKAAFHTKAAKNLAKK